jgi:aminopeptidase-like protein
MRTKYGCYPEYHTSLDDLELVTATGLLGSYEVLKKSIECLEANEVLATNFLCEPQLGKRGLHPTIGTKDSSLVVKNMMNFLAYCDGVSTNLEIAEKINAPLWALQDTINKLKAEDLLISVDLVSDHNDSYEYSKLLV